jgi:hypothetical protein
MADQVAPAASAAPAAVSTPAASSSPAPAASPAPAPATPASQAPGEPAAQPSGQQPAAAAGQQSAAAAPPREPKGTDYPQTEDGLAQFVREHDDWAQQNPEAYAKAHPGLATSAEEKQDTEPGAEDKQAADAAKVEEPGKAAEVGPLPQEFEAAIANDPALKAALEANPAAQTLIMDAARKLEAARPVLEIVPTVDDARFMATNANTMLDLRHNALLGIESPEARQGFWTGLKSQFVETDDKGNQVMDAQGRPVLGKDYDACLLTPAANEKLTGKLTQINAVVAELTEKLKGHYPSEAAKAADQKRLDDLKDDSEAIGWVTEMLKLEGQGDTALPALPADATPEQKKFQERLERERDELRKEREAAGKGAQTNTVKAFESEQRIGWQREVGKGIDQYLAEARERGEVIPDYILQERWIDPATKQPTQFPRLAVTILGEYDNTVMGMTRERNEIQRLERLGPAGRALREANAARLRKDYLTPIIQKHVKAIQDGIRQSTAAEAKRRGEIAKVARTEPQSGATPGAQPQLTEAQLTEKAQALAQSDPRWRSADQDERQIMLMTARTTVKWG